MRYKLFQVEYAIDADSDNFYLTTGTADDTDDTICKREKDKLSQKYGMLLYCYAVQIDTVDGLKVVLEE